MERQTSRWVQKVGTKKPTFYATLEEYKVPDPDPDTLEDREVAMLRVMLWRIKTLALPSNSLTKFWRFPKPGFVPLTQGHLQALHFNLETHTSTKGRLVLIESRWILQYFELAETVQVISAEFSTAFQEAPTLKVDPELFGFDI